MIEKIELTTLDLKYEHCRMKSEIIENRLLSSMLKQGIRDPLLGIKNNNYRILLDGYKRARNAKRLNINIVPFNILSDDEATGIINLLRISNSNSLSILEQAMLIDNLRTEHNMCNSDIADLLEKSRAWVSMRSGLIKEMSETVIKNIFSGKFPAYSYMYTIRQFMRMNCIKKKEIDEFVDTVSGQHLSTRDIECLAHGYFKGSNEMRQQIRDGNISWGLEQLRSTANIADGCTENEKKMINNLNIIQKYMNKVIYKANDKYKTNSFYSQANILCGGIMRVLENFKITIKDFYDRSTKTQSSLPSN